MAGRRRTRPRCGAKTKRGTLCQCAALPGKKRCRFHGGLSTGPVTAAGKRQAARNLEKARAALADPRFAGLRSESAQRGWTTRRLYEMRRQLREMAAEGDTFALRMLARM